MRAVFTHFAQAKSGDAVIDWIVLMSGIVLLTISITITVTSNSDTITDDSIDRAEQMEHLRPA